MLIDAKQVATCGRPAREFIIGSLTLLAAWYQVDAAARDPSKRDVEKGITHEVVFSITPTAAGKLGACSVESVLNLKKRALDPDLKPSETFVKDACSEVLAKHANWIPERDEVGEFVPVSETCKWSKVVPDQPICRLEINVTYAEELPKGVGYGSIFKLAADSTGHVANCEFSSMSIIAKEPIFVDITPHALFVTDACRKLASIKWQPSDGEGALRTFYMYCRYLPEIPVRAFCGEQFGR